MAELFDLMAELFPTIADPLNQTTVELKVSPREISLLLRACCEADAYLTGVRPNHLGETADLGCEQLRRWEALIDYIKDKALEHGA